MNDLTELERLNADTERKLANAARLVIASLVMSVVALIITVARIAL